jgi:hypothetical protein
LVVEAHSADIIATLILLKKEVEQAKGRSIKMTITGAAEAHLLAEELGDAGVGVILNPARSFPYLWEDRRSLPGPPITEQTPVSVLMAHNVTVGVGVMEIWDARNTRFDIAWVSFFIASRVEKSTEHHQASFAASGNMTKEEVLALGSTNIVKLLTSRVQHEQGDMVATRGGDLLDFGSKVVAVLSPSRGLVDIL